MNQAANYSLQTRLYFSLITGCHLMLSLKPKEVEKKQPLNNYAISSMEMCVPLKVKLNLTLSDQAIVFCPT